MRTQRRIWPAGGAACKVSAAGLAAVDGTGRDTRLLVFGSDGAALDELIAWHAATRAASTDPSRHARCRLVLPRDASPSLLHALAQRGFVYGGHALVLVRPLADLPAPDATVDIALVDRPQRSLATQVIARGYKDGAAPDPLDLRAAETWFDLPGATHLLAYIDGAPAGGGAVVVVGESALLGQMAVLPAYRGRGVQRALINQRLRHAREQGATLAVATSAPRGPSLRNLRRAGFEISHARICLLGC